jgi:hypothetical protein
MRRLPVDRVDSVTVVFLLTAGVLDAVAVYLLLVK